MLTSTRGTLFLSMLAVYLLLLCLQVLGWAEFGVWTLLGVYTALSVSVLIAVQGRIEHPATLFTLIFWFYVVGYPIVVEFGLLPDDGVTGFVITLHTIGYLGFVLPTLVRKPTKIPDFRHRLPPDSIKTLKLSIIVLMAMGTLQMLTSVVTGSYKGGGWQYLILATSAPQTYVVVAVAILLSQWLFSRHKLPVMLSVFVGLYTLIPLLITGRRTPGLIAVLVLIMLLEIRRRRLNMIKLTAIVMVGFITIGVSKYFGAYFVTGGKPSGVSSLFGGGWKSVTGHLFYEEFKTSGRLTAASIEYGKTHDFPTYGASYLGRLENSLAPGFLLSKNPTGIVNELNVFITNGGTETGLGYSIIAEGYNNFGIPGVFLNLFILGMIASALYRRAGRSPVWLGGYLVFLAITCARLRSGTLSIYLMSFYSLWLPMGLLCLARLLIYGTYSDRLLLTKRIKKSEYIRV